MGVGLGDVDGEALDAGRSDAGGPDAARSGVSRRSLLTKGAVATGALWVAPAIDGVVNRVSAAPVGSEFCDCDLGSGGTLSLVITNHSNGPGTMTVSAILHGSAPECSGQCNDDGAAYFRWTVGENSTNGEVHSGVTPPPGKSFPYSVVGDTITVVYDCSQHPRLALRVEYLQPCNSTATTACSVDGEYLLRTSAFGC